MVLLEDSIGSSVDEALVRAALARHGGDTEKTARSFNWVDLSDLFVASGPDEHEEQRLLAGRLAEVWTARLRAAYPQRDFVVEIIDPDETGNGFGVGFHESRGPKTTR